MITPHISSKKLDFSEVVIMSGDPLRIKYIAENFLNNSIKINNVRLMLGYTGYYKGKKISLMSHGIGIPSMSIYVRELVEVYNVKKIIRLGTCGSINKKIKMKDIIIAIGASTDSSMNRIRFNNYDLSAISNFKMLYQSYVISKKRNIFCYFGNIFSTDSFYGKNKKFFDLMQNFKILALDMETSGLYSLSSELNIKSISICTVSDCILNQEKMTTVDREQSLYDATKIALELSIL
ncbi:Purine nucleoside phosphorylase DeoD-type [Buchnera aphidicola (Chaitophorus populicola)]|uniref:purine-nucleoside phosphorylase n=1 Tax=Buchnera aphidicola TaxID=9 RepID=UPI00346458D5